jgi:hypothetical protein
VDALDRLIPPIVLIFAPSILLVIPLRLLFCPWYILVPARFRPSELVRPVFALAVVWLWAGLATVEAKGAAWAAGTEATTNAPAVTAPTTNALEPLILLSLSVNLDIHILLYLSSRKSLDLPSLA